MKRLIAIIALLLVPGMVWAEGYPGRSAPNRLIGCWLTNGVVSNQSFSNAQVLDNISEGCWNGSFVYVCSCKV